MSTVKAVLKRFNTPKLDYPAIGDIVRLTRYTEGNVYRGDQSKPDFAAVGKVIETPSEGSMYLVVATSESSPPVTSLQYDRERSEAWSITPASVTLRRSEFTDWTVELVATKDEEDRVENDERDRLVRVVQAIAADYANTRLITKIIDDMGLPVTQTQKTKRAVARALGWDEGYGWPNITTWLDYEQTSLGVDNDKALARIRSYLRAQ